MSAIQFSKAELERYSRHLIIPEFNIEGQRKLKAAKVLVVGSGGLGSPLLLYLAAAGVGNIGIVDFDVVDESNLQRQVLFDINTVGKLKCDAAKERILALNPHINVTTYNTKLSSENALEIVKDYDVVADGVFNYTNSAGELGPNYRDLFPTPPPPGLVPSCAEGGVLGVLPGIIGSLQANEVLKVVAGVGEPLSGRLFLFDALSFETRTLKVNRDDNNPLNGKNPTQSKLIDYVQFCGVGDKAIENQNKVKEISVQDFKRLTDKDSSSYQLIDVREPYEQEIATIGGELIPLNTVEESVARINKNKQVIIYCRSGKRSIDAIRALEKTFGFDNLYNLKGGILAYARQIDKNLPVY